MSEKISSLKGLGPRSEQHLNAIGIYTRDDLEAMGAVPAYLKLIETGQIKAHLSFLYAIVGALEDVSWLTIAREEKARLLFDLEGYAELEALQKSNKKG